MSKLSEDKFADYLNDIVCDIRHVLGMKAKEYVRNGDRMHNFNAAAKKKGITREQAIDGFRLKHEISVDDIRNDIAEGKLPNKDLVYEKFGDIINYYILEQISILDKINQSERED